MKAARKKLIKDLDLVWICFSLKLHKRYIERVEEIQESLLITDKDKDTALKLIIAAKSKTVRHYQEKRLYAQMTKKYKEIKIAENELLVAFLKTYKNAN